MIERRRKNNKDMKASMEEFWRELIETREIKYGKDDHFERNLHYCRNFSERAVLHKGDEWNLKNIVKYCYWCMDKLNKMTREFKNEKFSIDLLKPHLILPVSLSKTISFSALLESLIGRKVWFSHKVGS